MSEVRLYYQPGGTERRAENQGLYEQDPEKLLQRVREAGVQYAAIDVSGLPREEREHLYTQMAVTPSVRKRYRVKRLFGTNKYPGSRFGKEVPALVVLEDGRPQDVYPHEDEGGKIVTIKDYVDSLKPGPEGVQEMDALLVRMDALREKIGPIGASTADLVKEGRRR